MTRVSPGVINAPLAIDQEERQVQNTRALAPINGANVIGADGSQTPPQVLTMASPLDGELPRPSTLGNDYYRKARNEIRNDPTIRMMRELSIAPLLMAEWEYEADPNAPEGAKELVQSIMDEMRLRLLRTSLLGMCDYGWQPYEIIADARRDGTNGLRLKPLLQDLTVILVDAADGSFFGLRQIPMFGMRIGWIYMLHRDRECFVVSQDVEGTNWYGYPTLRALERTFDESEFVNRAARKYGAKVAGTHWVIYYPLGSSKYAGVTTDNGEIAKKLLSMAEAVGGIIVPRSVVQATDALNAQAAEKEATQWKIELLSDAGKGMTGFEERLKYLDVLKVRGFGFPERSVLEGQFGTKAEAGVHADQAVSSLEVKHALLVQQYNDKLVDGCILPWNYGEDSRGCVRIKPSPLQDDKIAFFQELYAQLLTNPQMFAAELSSLDLHQLRERLGLPEAPAAGAYDPGQAAWDPYADPWGQTLQGLPSGPQGPLGLPGGPEPNWTPPALQQEPRDTQRSFGGLSLRDDVDEAAGRAEKPTKAQRQSGNYRKGHVFVQGLPISIETPKGRRRHRDWARLPDHYGYIKGTLGNDGGQVDVFVGKKPEIELAFIANMLKPTGGFDEHKVLLGFKSRKKARRCLERAYDGAHHLLGSMTQMTIPELKDWLGAGRRARPVALAFDPNEARDYHGRWTAGKAITDDEAKGLVKHIAESMKKAGLATYVLPHYSDSQLKGLNKSSSNVTNWSVIDGDIKRDYKIDTPKGHLDVGVSVIGPKEGIRYREEYNPHFERTMFDPHDSDVTRVKEKIHSVLKKVGHNVMSVIRAGHDAGFGTKNVDFTVRIKK